MDDLLKQWRPASIRAAMRVAYQYKAKPQEKRDLLALAPSVLWSAIADGVIGADTPVSLAITILCRRMVGGSPGLRGVKMWRPDCVKVRLANGRRYFKHTTLHTFTDSYGAEEGGVEAFTDALVARAEPQVFEAIPQLLERVIAAASLSEYEATAVRSAFAGEQQKATAARLGKHREGVAEALQRARAKCKQSEAVAELLSYSGVTA